MTLYRVLSGSVKTSEGWKQPGEDLELSAEAAALLNKNGRKMVEPTSVALARVKATTDAEGTLAKAEAEAKKKAEEEKLKAEAEAKKKGGGK